MNNVSLIFFYQRKPLPEARKPKFWKWKIVYDIKCWEHHYLIPILISRFFFLTRGKGCHKNFSSNFCVIFCPLFRIHFESSWVWWKIGSKMNYSFLFSICLFSLLAEESIRIFYTFFEWNFGRPIEFPFCFFWVANGNSEVNTPSRNGLSWDFFIYNFLSYRKELSNRSSLSCSEIPHIP